jgi:hypothetical protein
MRRKSNKLILALPAVFVLVVSSLPVAAQALPQSGDQSQTDSSTAKKATKQKTDTSSTSSKAGTSSGPTLNTPAANAAASKTTTSTASAKKQTLPASSVGMVWVNTDSGVYHKPGTRWYGKTKKGKYMLEADAVKAGYKAAK